MKSWYVIYVKSRAEKKVAKRLEEQGIEIFFPLKTEIRQWSDRKKKVIVPFFSTYIFVKINYKTERLAILQTVGVVQFLFWLRKPALIRKEEMQEVITFFQNYEKKNIQQEKIKLGERYRVEKGPFVGKVGKAKENSGNRVVLEIPGLQVRFYINKTDLKPAAATQ